MKPVCLVIGAGAGIGGTVGTRFAAEGYHTVLCRRTDQEGLDRLVQGIEAAGGSASGFLLNAVDQDSIEERIHAIEKDIGGIDVVVFNLGAQIAIARSPARRTRPLKWVGVWQRSRCSGRLRRCVRT